jgi:putative oxidoreductase
MRALFVLGRAMFGGYFVYNGLNHFLNHKMMSQYAASKGVSNADVAVPTSGSLLVAGGLSVIAGIKPRQGLVSIIAFLIPVSLQMHRFWEVEGQQERMSEMVNFMKNMALVGAALTMMQIEEPWPIGIDEARSANEDMYIHLGGRDLRALPA